MIDIETKTQLLRLLDLTNQKVAEHSDLTIGERLKLYGVENHVMMILRYSDHPDLTNVIDGSMSWLRAIDMKFGFGVFRTPSEVCGT